MGAVGGPVVSALNSQSRDLSSSLVKIHFVGPSTILLGGELPGE